MMQECDVVKVGLSGLIIVVSLRSCLLRQLTQKGSTGHAAITMPPRPNPVYPTVQ